ncbi:hypothetical protein AURDEDRAFT_130366 [Auricularia subglabra TFB-10046 SS5]|nr:hypothetical protein AURDEDRAFT_130366 [Auricularia subglabra TFB-10046 SS5]
MQSPEQIPDIRHVGSLPTLTTPPSRKATSIHRMGSLSPASIPSSPTSVHSSSSAIFERDIEPLPAGTMHLHPHPHRTPRSKGTEGDVPSVLTSAASALAATSAPASPSAPSTELGDPFVVIAPAAQIVGSPSGGTRTASPSGRASPAREQSPRRRTSTAASISGLSGSPPLLPSPLFSGSPPSLSSPLPVPVSAEATTGPSANRLSFISYNDLLLSAPVAAVPLQSLVQPTSVEAPPHLPAVQAAASITHSPARSRPRSMVGPGNRASVLLGDDVGGEWEREGLGRGLEERLEELLKLEQQTQAQSQAPQAPQPQPQAA